MRNVVRFLAVLIPGLALLTFGAYEALARTTRGWFERDLTLRAKLAVTSAELGLSSAWRSGDTDRLAHILARMTLDERIMGAAACTPEGALVAMSAPSALSSPCNSVDAKPREGDGSPRAVRFELPGGPAELSVHTLTDSEELGTVVLIHDLSFMRRREMTTWMHALVTFFVLAVCASAFTLVAARIAWRDFVRGLREALAGRATRDFVPIVGHVRELLEQLRQEQANEQRAGRWGPERLRAALTEHLHGERIAILANREPYIHDRTNGQIRVLHPASGLVSALEPVMRACSGVWVAHGGGSADRETVDARDRVQVPPHDPSYSLRRVWLTPEEERGYYYGFSNEGLWPLCHVAHTRPTFRASDYTQYERVNQRFAAAVCDEVDSDDPIILVQDYHFALAPRMIRERLPRATILTFWHIPWPNAERFGICPFRDEILHGLLGSSILGFHTHQHCNNFLEAVDSFIESRIDREQRAIVQGARSTLVRSYPISIEWPVRWLDDLPDAARCRASVQEEHGLPAHVRIGVGVDRLDYTKGIEERLQAVDELLARHPRYRGRFTFIQLAAPSRTQIDHYRELNERVEALAQAINARWQDGDYRPIILHRAHHEPSTVFRYYRAADLCYVSSLHDGMNLVAKEFVAAREDGRGVLVLSQFTGAARELTEALIVNPYHLEQAADALSLALEMPLSEQAARMRSMRRMVSEFNVYRWAGRMLVDAAELRRHERLAGHLTNGTKPASRAAIARVGLR